MTVEIPAPPAGDRLSLEAELLLAALRDAGANIAFVDHARLAALGATTACYFELVDAHKVFEYFVDGRRVVRTAHPLRPRVTVKPRLEVGMKTSSR